MEELTKLELEVLEVGLTNSAFSYITLKGLCDKYSETRVYLCCKSLAERGYFDKKLFSEDGIPLNLSLNYDAYSYIERRTKDSAKFFRRSVLYPFLVSVATTLTISVIKWFIFYEM